MEQNKVQLEVFEGPLDLLLYLVKKEEVDIYEVNLTKIATQFVAYVDLMRELDLDIAGEFLVMASTLMYIKSRELLPKEQQAVVEEEEDQDDPRWELIRQLVEYKKFKDAAAQLQSRESEQENIFARVPGRVELEPEATSGRPEVSLFDLINAVNAILKRFAEKDRAGRDVFADQWTVSEKIEALMKMSRERPAMKFSELFADTTSRTEVVVTFLALLELIRMKQLRVLQSGAFSDIEISVAPTPVASPHPVEGTESLPAPAANGIENAANPSPVQGEGSDAAENFTAKEPAKAETPHDEDKD